MKGYLRIFIFQLLCTTGGTLKAASGPATRAARALVKTWEVKRRDRNLDPVRKEITLTLSDPKTRLEVRNVGVVYQDFPVVEWTLYFKNAGAATTPILEDVEALDTRFERNAE